MKTRKTIIGTCLLMAAMASGNASMAAISPKAPEQGQTLDDRAPVQANPLVGKWALTDIRAFAQNGSEVEGDFGGDVYYTFSSDNVVEIEQEYDDVYQYEIKNGKLTIDGDGSFFSSIVKASITKRSNNKLELVTVDEDGTKMIWYFKKLR